MAAVLVGVSTLGVLTVIPGNTTAESHDPIYINGDAGFEAVIAVSGVRSGTLSCPC